MAAASIVSALVAAGVVWMWTGVYLPGAGLSISLLLVLLVGLLAGGRSPRGAREWLLVAACALENLTFFFFMSTSLRLVNLPVAAGLTAADAVFAERPPESRRGGSGRARRNAADSAARVRPIHTGAVPRAAAGEDFHGNRGGVDHLRARAGRGDAASVLG